LKAYTSCRFSNGFSVASVDRLPGQGLRYRTVQTPTAAEKVSMVDGYRVMLSVHGRSNFANLHVEESDPSRYPSDKEAVIKSLETIVSASGRPSVSRHSQYNGFDIYSSTDTVMGGNGPAGMSVLFRDSSHMIATIYFLGQRAKDRNFGTLAEYNVLKEKMLVDFTICASEGATRITVAKAREPELTPERTLTVDTFDSVSQWRTNPAQGVQISIHSDSGRHGHAMRVDFDFHGHPGYGIVNRKVDLDLPANYEFAFAVRGEAPQNTLEFKLVDPSGANVWWSRNTNFSFSREWRTITRKKRQICFAWGPIGGGEIRHVSAIEFAITAGSGGKGSVWIDDLSLSPLDQDSPFDLIAPVVPVPLVGSWESPEDSNRGVGVTHDFASDGSLTLTFGASRFFDYSVVGNLLTTTLRKPLSGKNEIHVTQIRFDHEDLIEHDANGPGNDLTMKRVGTMKEAANPIVGIWKYLDYTGATEFVAFTSNGKGMLRLPMSSCSGTWTEVGGGYLTVSINGQAPTQCGYSIDKDVLTVRNGNDPGIRYYRRIPLQ
jgi:hypothetical protein